MKIARTQLIAVPLGEVLKFYAEEFRVVPTGKILRWEAYVDVAKDKVIFDLIVEEPEKEKS